MSIQTLGLLMLAAPFVAFFCYMVAQAGWRVALSIYGLTALITAWIVVGAQLAASK